MLIFFLEEDFIVILGIIKYDENIIIVFLVYGILSVEVVIVLKWLWDEDNIIFKFLEFIEFLVFLKLFFVLFIIVGMNGKDKDILSFIEDGVDEFIFILDSI